jgi:hypothetical protein
MSRQTWARVLLIAGLLFDLAGAVLVAYGAHVTDGQAADITVTRWAADTKAEQAQAPAAQNLLQQSKYAVRGVILVALGFALQIAGVFLEGWRTTGAALLGRFKPSTPTRRPRGRYRADRAKAKAKDDAKDDAKTGVPWLEIFKLVMPIVAVLVAFVLGGRAQQEKDRREGERALTATVALLKGRVANDLMLGRGLLKGLETSTALFRGSLPEPHPQPLHRADLLPPDVLPGLDHYERLLRYQKQCYDDSGLVTTTFENRKAMVLACLRGFVQVGEGLGALLNEKYPHIQASESRLGTPERTIKIGPESTVKIK